MFRSLVPMALVALIACGGGNGGKGGGKGADTSTSDPGPTGPLKIGCQDWSNWTCPDPSAGFEFGCEAICGDNYLICNQEYGAQGTCRMAGVPDCPAPAGSGCEICEASVNGCMASAITP